MIEIKEVLEEAARVCDESASDLWKTYKLGDEDGRGRGSDYVQGGSDTAHLLAEAIRALAAKWDGCIVAEGAEIVDEWWIAPNKAVPLYRAKEPK
jgi:hypothetical protein